ncbi:Senescence and/or MIT domain containing protein [Asbolus verrucosus]|uniref:Senescence and/or MIT domain containing protein n=1 Tax=Asbolus verrucosus TaxID=1661398 RepID=A0A482W7U0_ASBVE|nr:Senescence and/or MIT domain containing protein [Asbolus verrucosus]
MGNGASTSSWSATYTEIKSKHDAAYVAIQNAITLEEEEKPDEAVKKYKEGIQLIDEALRIQVTCPENPEFTWEKAVVMIQKMKKTRAEVLTRINCIQKSTEQYESVEHPPSYEEAMASTPTETPQTYNELASALNRLTIDTIDTNTPMEAEVVYMYEGVKLYFISPAGEVSSTLRPQTLKIILVDNEGENVPRAILQIGTWVYPLIPGVSPCYRADYGAFILPNVYAETPGSSIGIILPSDADADAYEVLESILYGIVGESKPPEMLLPPSEDLSEKISNGIVTGASFLSRGLVTGAEKVGNLLNLSTPKLINRMNSTDRPAEIPAGVTRSMQIAETATNKAARVTGYVAEQVGVATVKLGKFLAPHIQKQGTRLLTSGFRMSEEDASNKVKGVMTVAAGAVEGFSTVYRGLENSASILGQSLKNNTVKVVQHKYGQPAGEFAGDTLSTVGNVYQISQNTKVIQPKHLAKRTAKEAGKAVVHGYKYKSSRGASTSNQVEFPYNSRNGDVSKHNLPPEKK